MTCSGLHCIPLALQPFLLWKQSLPTMIRFFSVHSVVGATENLEIVDSILGRLYDVFQTAILADPKLRKEKGFRCGQRL